MNASDFLSKFINRAHSSWHQILLDGLSAIEVESPGYLQVLSSATFLPQGDHLFAAFSQPMSQVTHVLIGEGPYPRTESANGYCFMDGAVGSLWSDDANGGLSKQVNRATSLRNFVKMLLVAEKHIGLSELNSASIADFVAQARLAPANYIQSMAQLQGNFLRQGFLLLNATLVFREDTPPLKDAKAWLPFLEVVLRALSLRSANEARVKVILWGKIAERLKSIGALNDSNLLTTIRAEHPYNLSFIANPDMHRLFGPLQLLKPC